MPKLKKGFKNVSKDNGLTKRVRAIKEAQEVSKEEHVYNELLHELSKDGVEPFNNDNVVNDFLQLPCFLTDTTSRELGNYFNTFTMQRMYVRNIMGRLKAHIRDIESDLDDVRATLYPSLPVKMSIKEKEVALLTLVDAKELIKAQRGYQGKLDIVKGYMESLEDGIHNISREITRRGKDFDDSQRGDNIK